MSVDQGILQEVPLLVFDGVIDLEPDTNGVEECPGGVLGVPQLPDLHVYGVQSDLTKSLHRVRHSRTRVDLP